MRISVRRDDPGFEEALRLGIDPKRVRVLLDGVLLTGCVTADSDVGLVVRYRVGPDGGPQLTPRGDEIAIEIAYGRVLIEVPGRDDPARDR